MDLSQLSRVLPWRRSEERTRNKYRRIAIFAAFDANFEVPERTVFYLRELRKVADAIIFVSDNPTLPDELKKLDGIVLHSICERHGEYDFGSYKRGYFYARHTGLLDGAQELVLCNDSCFGPVAEFKTMFDRMRGRDCDFWGITDSNQFNYHLQSYFLCLSRKVFRHRAFTRFIARIKKEPSVQAVIRQYEVRLTARLIERGFKACAYITERIEVNRGRADDRLYGEHFPIFLMERGAPLIKVKGLTEANCNSEGIDRTLQWVARANPSVYRQAVSYNSIARYEKASTVAFSIIMPTYNRRHVLDRAIGSVLAQWHRSFELIIVDDGSEDGTEGHIRTRYAKEIGEGRIVFIRHDENIGPSGARNIGLAAAKHPWIAYVDSDNSIREYFLTVFAQNIIQNPSFHTFYCAFRYVSNGLIRAEPFNFDELLKGNYIDLGAFVHHVDCYRELGAFDPELAQLEDWDVLLKYTRRYTPLQIPHILLDYHDEPDLDRRSLNKSSAEARFKIFKGMTRLPTVSTVIVSYNHDAFVGGAIKSALAQRGNFVQEIIVSDDGSSDKTRQIIGGFAAEQWMLIRDLSSDRNVGVSANYKRCFDAALGDYIAVLEGDDYWLDELKLQYQVEFLEHNPDCSMVFSKIRVENVEGGTVRTLRRQEEIRDCKLDGSHFLAHPTMNLIGNYSCCMFRTELIRKLPEFLFETRISEVTVAFFLENFGKIGFINRTMSAYRQHARGVWSGASREQQFAGHLDTLRKTKTVARDAYKDRIQCKISEAVGEAESVG